MRQQHAAPPAWFIVNHRLVSTFATMGFVAGLGIAALGQSAPATVLAGVYSDAQAQRGEAAYAEHCGHCHGANLDGIGAAPMLYSSRFLDRWREDSLRTLYDYTAANMPLDAGAKKLPETQYLDILAYLLYVNDLPPGTTELTLETVDRTQLVGPEGPKPLPPSTTVRIVGCLAQKGGTWTLSPASVPARVLKADSTDATEIEQSRGTALGPSEFRLPTLSDDHEASTLTGQIGKKVQIKGVLNTDDAGARLSVLSFTPLGGECPR